MIKKNCLTKAVISYDLSPVHITQVNDKILGQFFSIILVIDMTVIQLKSLNIKVLNLEYYETNK